MMTQYGRNKIVKRVEEFKAKVREIWDGIMKWVPLTSVFIGLFLGVAGAIYVINWFNGHVVILRSPFQSPVIIKEVIKDTEKKVEAQEPAKNKQNSAIFGHLDAKTGMVTAGMTKGQVAYEAYKTARFHESTNGKETGLNAYCVSLGKINEIGYDPQNNFCFKDQAEQVATAVNWFRNCLEKDTINSCLKVYSNGVYSEIYYE